MDSFIRVSFIAVTGLSVTALPALAHTRAGQPYGGYVNQQKTPCCHEQHCKPLEDDQVEETPAGSVVTRNSGRLVITPESTLRATQPSINGGYHICENSQGMICFISPPKKVEPIAKLPAPMGNAEAFLEAAANFVQQMKGWSWRQPSTPVPGVAMIFAPTCTAPR